MLPRRRAAPPAVLLFDLDGTLIESAVGITRCVAHALDRVGHPPLTDAVLRRWIGPPLRDSFTPLLRDPLRVEAAVAHYRERFETDGWHEHTVYAGIGEVVRGAQAAGYRLAVVTAKNEAHAMRIVEHLPFGDAFETVVGATLCGRLSHKPELIAEALARLDVSAADCAMIGDRAMDIHGAHHHAMPGLGVLWGFGGIAELEGAGATTCFDTPAALARWLARPG
jgi:phosphoglycolate phosphatase